MFDWQKQVEMYSFCIHPLEIYLMNDLPYPRNSHLIKGEVIDVHRILECMRFYHMIFTVKIFNYLLLMSWILNLISLCNNSLCYIEMENEICGEDVECISVGTSSGKKRGRREKKNTTWTESADECLADILIEQINLRRNDETGWTTEGWREIERKMKEKDGREYVKDKIRNCLRTLKHH